jgi:hypothetical protein
MTPYAEQIMEDRKRNTWFLLFHNHLPTWDPQTAEQHGAWMRDNLVNCVVVRGMGDTECTHNLYHVDFEDASDPRLAAYMMQFENAAGESLYPEQYQMLEWSYKGWCDSGGRQEFLDWLEKQA